MLQVLDSAETWFARTFGSRRGHRDSDLCAELRATSNLDDYARLKRAFAALRREHGMVARLLRSELEANDIIWPEDKDMVCVRVDLYRQECRRIAEGISTPPHLSSRLHLTISYHAHKLKSETQEQNGLRTDILASLVCRVLRENSLNVSWDGDIYSPIFVKPESLPTY